MTQLLTVNEAAAILKMNPATVYRATRSGTLPHVRIGRSVRIPQDQLERLIVPVQANTETPKPAGRVPVMRL